MELLDKARYTILPLSRFDSDISEESLLTYAKNCASNYLKYMLPLDVKKRPHTFINEEIGCVVICSCKKDQLDVIIEDCVRYER